MYPAARNSGFPLQGQSPRNRRYLFLTTAFLRWTSRQTVTLRKALKAAYKRCNNDLIVAQRISTILNADQDHCAG